MDWPALPTKVWGGGEAVGYSHSGADADVSYDVLVCVLGRLASTGWWRRSARVTDGQVGETGLLEGHAPASAFDEVSE